MSKIQFYIFRPWQHEELAFIEKAFAIGEWTAGNDGEVKSIQKRPMLLLENYVDKTSLPDVLIGFPGFLVVNKKVVDLLDSFQVNVQLGEVRFEEKVQAPLKYYILNPLTVLDAIDYKLSEYSTWPESMGSMSGKIRKVRKLVLDQSKVEGHHLFKVNHQTPYPFISSELKNLLEQNGITGCKYIAKG